MNRIAPIVGLALVCGACTSTRGGQYGTHQEFNANCRVRDQEISIEVETNGQPVTGLELVLQDGTVLQPGAVRGPRGKEIALGSASDSPDSHLMLDTHKQPSHLVVSFPISSENAGPRQLVVTPTEGDSASILLAKVKGQEVDSRYAAFGYTRELRTFPDGSKETVYVRTERNGDRHEISQEDFEFGIANSITKIYEALPSTAKEIEDAPDVTHFLASIFEQGCNYDGDAASSEAGVTPDHSSFVSKQVRVVHYDNQGHERKDEDPLSTITRFLVEAINASGADELRALHDRAREGQCDENQFIHAEATFKARNLKQAMDILRANADGLSISDWKNKKYGHYFTLYMGWVRKAEADSESEEATISRLAGIILQSLTRKGLGAGEKPIPYRLKLQRQFGILTSDFTE